MPVSVSRRPSPAAAASKPAAAAAGAGAASSPHNNHCVCSSCFSSATTATGPSTTSFSSFRRSPPTAAPPSSQQTLTPLGGSRPLQIVQVALLNLMPNKVETEKQLMRMLDVPSLDVKLTLLYTATHAPTHTDAKHLAENYFVFNEIRHRRFDGLIITGAPVEMMPFEKVDYWPELCEILKWAETNVNSTFHICWGSQAGLYYRHGIDKYELLQKASGVFEHKVFHPTVPLVRGFDDRFFAPHSRHTDVKLAELLKDPELLVLAASDAVGMYIAMSKDGKHIYVSGHSEYDPNTLKNEYERDIKKGMDVPLPCHYFPNDDPSQPPVVRWRGHGHLLYANWLHFYVAKSAPPQLRSRL